MELMDQEEADKMKGFLGSLDIGNNDAFTPANKSAANYDTNSNNHVTRENTTQQQDQQKDDQEQE